MLTFILLLLVILVAIRFLGERALPVVPETIPPVVINQQTPLYQQVQKVLQTDPKANGSFLYPLSNPHLAILNRLLLADAAKDTLDVQYYLFHDDDAGRAVLKSLETAAKRGVRVRLLLDDMDTLGQDGVFARLVAENTNMQIRIFNPFWIRNFRYPEYPARFPRVTRRMHSKSYTVDGVVSIVGGRNVGNEYFNYNTEVDFADFDLMVAGAVGKQATEKFDQYWYSGLAVDINRLGKPANNEKFNDWNSKATAIFSAYHQELERRHDLIKDLLTNSTKDTYFANIDIIEDSPYKVVSKLYSTEGNITPDIVNMMKSAQKELVISSPYFIPGKLGLDVFQELRNRGVEIIILTNSFAANDVVAVHAGYINYRKQLVEMGVKLYELKPLDPNNKANDDLSLIGSKRASLHAKAFIVDRKSVFVGSFNLDARSSVHNTEMGVVFEQPEYGEASVERTLTYMRNMAYHVVLDAKGDLEWRDKVGTEERVQTKEPDMGFFAGIIITVISWLPVEWLM